MPKRALLLLIVLCLSSLALYASGPLTILKSTLSFEREKITIYVEYPLVSGTENPEVASKINSTIESDALGFFDYFRGIALAGVDEVMTAYAGHVSYEVVLNTSNLLSINIIYYEFTGGAHGMTEMINYTFNTTTGERLKLEDLFKEGTNYIQAIIEEVVKQIEKTPEMFFDDAVDVVRESPFNFYLAPDAFVAYYGLYAICPYAHGIPEFKIPYELLRDFLLVPLGQ